MFWLSPHEGLAWEPLARSMRRRATAGQARFEPQGGRGRMPPGGAGEATSTPEPSRPSKPGEAAPRLMRVPLLATPNPRRAAVLTRPIDWILAVTLASVAVAPAHAGGLSFTSTYSDGDERVESCSDIEMRFSRNGWGEDDIVTARRSQTLSLATSASKSLRVEGTNAGGV